MRIINAFRTTGRPYFDCADFCHVGFGKITGFAGTVGYIASHGLPLPPVGGYRSDCC